MVDPVSLSADVLRRYERFSLYNSPYVAHDHGCAIDLYPGRGKHIAPSPVAGEVIDTRTVKAPPKSYAADHDHLVLIDCGDRIARTLHVEPTVEPGNRVAIGDPLGRLVRAGFFAPWVDNHLHLGFRALDANPYRASGSLPIVPAIDVRALSWDGSGIVTETGETYAVLDAPAHPDPSAGVFAGIGASFVPDALDEAPCQETSRPRRTSELNGPTEAAGTDRTDGTDGTNGTNETVPDDPADAPATGANTDPAGAGGVRPVALDGGLPHYDGGGVLPTDRSASRLFPLASDPQNGRVDFLGTEIGRVRRRDVSWHPVSVCANGEGITGLSLFCGRDRGFGAKLVCPATRFERGERVTVSIRAAR